MYLQLRFKREVRFIEKKKGTSEFIDIVNFVKKAILEANHPIFGLLASAVRETPSTRRSHLVTTAAVINKTDYTQGARPKRNCAV